MASDTSLKDALARLSKVEDVLKGDWTDAGNKVGLMAKREATEVAGQVTGGSGVMSHMGRGARLRARYDLDDQGRKCTVSLQPPGPWVIMEQGAKPHEIGPRRGARHTVFGGAMFGGQGAPAIMAPSYSHPVYRVHHPGMRQKRGAIRKTFGRIRGKASETFHDEMVKKIEAIYG